MKDSSVKYIIIAVCLVIIIGMLILSIKEGFTVGADGFQICSTLTNCGTCSSSFGCVWCYTDAKCVSDNSANAICPRQALISTPGGCDVAHSTDASGNGGLVSVTNKVCSASSSCNSCLSIPDCFWCSTQNICSSSIDVYAQCPNDMHIFSSFSQCSLGDTTTTVPSTSSLSRSSLESLIASLTASLTSTTSSSTSTSTSTSAAPVTNASSIIPIIGLSRNLEGSLTSPAMQTVVQSLQSQGYNISNAISRRNVLAIIKAETDQVKAQKKLKLNSYVGNSVDYISDGASLDAIKNYDIRLLDLHDISQYIQSVPLEGFREGFTLGLSELQSANDYNRQSLKISGSNLQLMWFANLVAIGTLIYFING